METVRETARTRGKAARQRDSTGRHRGRDTSTILADSDWMVFIKFKLATELQPVE